VLAQKELEEREPERDIGKNLERSLGILEKEWEGSYKQKYFQTEERNNANFRPSAGKCDG
jgi:hypothetical protein